MYTSPFPAYTMEGNDRLGGISPVGETTVHEGDATEVSIFLKSFKLRRAQPAYTWQSTCNQCSWAKHKAYIYTQTCSHRTHAAHQRMKGTYPYPRVHAEHAAINARTWSICVINHLHPLLLAGNNINVPEVSQESFRSVYIVVACGTT